MFTWSPVVLSRREPDAEASLGASFRAAFERATSHDLPIAGGQFLLLATGLIVASTLPLLKPSDHAWGVFAVIAGALSILVVASARPWWRELPGWCSLSFPAVVGLALAALGLGGHAIAASYTGLFVLCFAFIGLTQPAGTSTISLPVAIAAWIAANDGWSSILAPRLIIAVLIWILLGEALAQMMIRHRTLQEQLRRAAHLDALTGVANRRGLALRLATVETGDVVILCDLDHFKAVNDSRGHAAGDQALADFGSALRASIRATDFAARYGGEEFAIVLAATQDAGAQVVLQRLHRHWSLLQPGLTFSAGIATCDPALDGPGTLAAADSALYRAKTSGRNQDSYAEATSSLSV